MKRGSKSGGGLKNLILVACRFSRLKIIVRKHLRVDNVNRRAENLH